MIIRAKMLGPPRPPVWTCGRADVLTCVLASYGSSRNLLRTSAPPHLRTSERPDVHTSTRPHGGWGSRHRLSNIPTNDAVHQDHEHHDRDRDIEPVALQRERDDRE